MRATLKCGRERLLCAHDGRIRLLQYGFEQRLWIGDVERQVRSAYRIALDIRCLVAKREQLTSFESGDVSDDVFGAFFHEYGDGAAMAASEGTNKVGGEGIGDLVELAKSVVDDAVGGTKYRSIGRGAGLLTKDVVE